LSLDARAGSKNAVMTSIKNRHLEVERQRELAIQEQKRELALQAKRNLLGFLQQLRAEAPSWRDSRGMMILPVNIKDATFAKFENLVAVTMDQSVVDFTRYLRQQLNATSAFVRLGTLDEAIEKLEELV
ncbi:MAG: hypothetical protein O3B47_03375, partial [bacterium]|nr:hypothetical protein [bacterium]